MPQSIRTQLATLLLGVTVPLIVLLFVALFLWNDSERSNAEGTVSSRADNLNDRFLAMVDESRRTLLTFQKDRGFDWTAPGVVQKFFGSYHDRFPFSTGPYLFSLDGRVVAPAGDGAPASSVSVKDRQWFLKALSTQKFVIGEYIVSRISGLTVIPMALEVRSPGGHPYIVGMSIDLKWFYDRLREALPAETTFTLVSPKGVILARYPSPEPFVGKDFSQTPIVQAATLGNNVAGVYRGLDGVIRLYSARAIVLDGQFLGAALAGVPLATVHRESSEALVAAWALVAAIVAAGVLLAVWGMRRMVLRPIQALSDQTRALSLGRFDERLPSATLPRELAVLATSVNTLAESLQSRDQEIATYRDHLEDTVRERTRELEAAQAELVRSNTDLQQFAYVASHDLQEPLRMVASFSQLLDRDYGSVLDDRGKQYLGFAVDGATRMQRLINDLLSYSRVETHARPLVAVDPARSVAVAVANLQRFLDEKNATVTVGPLPPALADQGQLTQVFQNLVGNGVKFNRSAHPTVTVQGKVRADMVEFEVTDNGIGLGADFGERVFVIFQRLNPRSEFPGTGIGLAICKRIVEHHGGKIWYEAAEGGGTRFLFTLKAQK